jgi:hypothetical protein
MSIFSGGIMKENELTMFSKVIITGGIILPMIVSSSVNIEQQKISHPFAFLITIAGFIFFLIAKSSVILHKKRVSFGSGLMAENMKNSYRMGYYLMFLGILFTF